MGGILKGVWKQFGIQWPHPCNLVGSWNTSLAGYCGCSWCQHTARSVCLPQLLSKRENTAFEWVLQSARGLSSPGKQVARSSTPLLEKKPATFGVTVAKIYATRDTSVGNRNNCEKQAQG